MCGACNCMLDFFSFGELSMCFEDPCLVDCCSRMFSLVAGGWSCCGHSAFASFSFTFKVEVAAVRELFEYVLSFCVPYGPVVL